MSLQKHVGRRTGRWTDTFFATRKESESNKLFSVTGHGRAVGKAQEEGTRTRKRRGRQSDTERALKKKTRILTSVHLSGATTFYCDSLRAGRSGDRILVGARFSAPVQTDPVAHPTSCTMGSGSFPGVKGGRGVMLTPHPILVSWSRKSRAIPLLPLWAVQPVQSLSACTKVHLGPLS